MESSRSREMISQGKAGNEMSRLILSAGEVRHFLSGEQLVTADFGCVLRGEEVGDLPAEKKEDEGCREERNQAAQVSAP